MYSGMIIQRNCSYLGFKGTGSNTFLDSSHPPTSTQPPAVTAAAAAADVPAVCAAAAVPFAGAVR